MINRSASRVRVHIFLLALLLRIGWVLMAGGDALASSDDAKAYNDLAVNLVQRHQYVTTIDPPHRIDLAYAQRPPLTPFVLALVYFCFGFHLLAVQILFAVLGAVNVLLLYLLGKRLFSERVGLTAGFLAAIYPFFVFLTRVPLTENLAVALYSLLALALTANGIWYSTKHAAYTGGVLGLAALNRPQILGFLPFLVLMVPIVARQPWRTWMRWLGVAVGCAALVVAPWIIRNHAKVGGWVPVSVQGGMALYEGNNEHTQTSLDKQWAGARGWYNDPRFGSDLSGSSSLEVDRQASRLAIAFIRGHPWQTLHNSVEKVGIFFSSYSSPIARLSWYPVLVLSLLGFLWTAREWRLLLPLHFLILQTMLTAAVFTSMPRFRAPVEPLFLLMAAVAIHRLLKRKSASTAVM